MAMYNHWAERLANTNTGIFLANDSSEIVLPWTLVFFYYNTPPCNLQSFSGQNALFVFISSLCIKIKNFLCELRPKFDLQMFRNIISNQNHSIRNQIVFYHVIWRNACILLATPCRLACGATYSKPKEPSLWIPAYPFLSCSASNTHICFCAIRFHNCWCPERW